MFKFPRTLNTNGNGLWSDEARAVKVTCIRLNADEGDTFGELMVEFDTDTWDIDEHGLIYTDPQFLKELRRALREAGFNSTDVEYSEQGMQGDDYVSLDVGEKFIKSWHKLVDKFVPVL